MTAQQGHTYQHAGQRVMALETGPVVTVAVIEPDAPWFVFKYTARAEWLKPLPMTYFGGVVP